MESSKTMIKWGLFAILLSDIISGVSQIHVWDQGTPLQEQLSAMNYLLQSGKVRYLAMSNAKGWQIQKIVEMSKNKNWEPFVCLQVKTR